MEEKSLRNNRPKAWDRINMTTKSLKPCPFCGGFVTTRVSESTGLRWFDCNTCSVAARFEQLTQDEAIEAWNTRE